MADLDTFAPIAIPVDKDEIQRAFGTLQTWATRLRDMDIQVYDALLGVSGALSSVIRAGAGMSTAGVTIGGKTITAAQASALNAQGYFNGTNPEGLLEFGAYFDGTNFIAAATTATILLSTSAIFIVYSNTGLTPGLVFTPTRVMEIDSSTGAFAFTSGQLRFPATQVPSSNANTLDDYEEGAWTPNDGSGASLVFTVSEGRYVKIGQLVVLEGVVTYPVTANGSTAKVGGLPFTQLASSTSGFGSATFGFNDTTLHIHGVLGGAVTAMTLFTNAGVGVTNAQMSGKTIEFTISYRAAA